MAKGTEIYVKSLYSAYGSYINGHQYQYLCDACDQKFAASWDIAVTPFNPYANRGNRFHCPHCGASHEKHIIYAEKDEFIPFKVKLAVKTYKKAVVLEVSYEAFAFLDLLKTKWCQGKEIFRFDLDKRQASFTKSIFKATFDSDKGDTSFLFGSPFDTRLLKESVLRYFLSHSIPMKVYRSSLISMVKEIREAIKSKIEERDDQSIKSMHINSISSSSGLFLLPLMNMAFRMILPEANNSIPPEYHYSEKKMNEFKEQNCTANIPIDLVEQLSSQLVKGTDGLDAVISIMELPNKDTVRRLVRENVFSCGLLKVVFSFCKNYDLAIRLYAGLIKFKKKDNIISFLKEMLPLYGESGIIRLIEQHSNYRLDDCIRLYGLLNAQNCHDFAAAKIRMRDMHDWMSYRHKTQEHTNYQLNIPDNIVRRMSMQTDRLKFFLPQESMDLLNAGISLHNCVASYSKAVQDGSKRIILVSDDKGKLVGCIAIQGNTIVEAKLDRNKPLSNDPVLNQAVTDWAKTTNLLIKTSDINLEEKKATLPMSVAM